MMTRPKIMAPTVALLATFVVGLGSAEGEIRWFGGLIEGVPMALGWDEDDRSHGRLRMASGLDLPIRLAWTGGEHGAFTARPTGASRWTGAFEETGRLAVTFEEGPVTRKTVLEPKSFGLWPNRTQNPAGAVPYEVREVRFEGGAEGVTLAGTLTLPRPTQTGGADRLPGVVLLTGSGPQDRDESIFGHRPFAVLADRLTRQGMAVLRFDDRGIGGSTGEFASATTPDLASDGRAAVRWLRNLPEIDRQSIGLVGHSEGAILATMIAIDEPVRAVVLWAGPAVPTQELLLAQAAAIARDGGADEEAIDRNAALQRELFEWMTMDPPPEDLVERMATAIRRSLPPLQRLLTTDAKLESMAREYATPWWRFFVDYDPSIDLARLDLPTLVLHGDRDLQVLVSQNHDRMIQAIAASGTYVKSHILVDHNHLFQTVPDGVSPMAYGEIDETISDEALTIMADWLEEWLATDP